MNVVTLVGRATKDTEMNGKTANTNLAVDRPYPFGKDKDGNSVTDFLMLRHIGERNAERAEQYIKKGVKIACRGIICRDTYKKDGEWREFNYIICQEWEFAESKSAQKANSNGSSDSKKSDPASDDFMSVSDSDDDGVPFI